MAKKKKKKTVMEPLEEMKKQNEVIREAAYKGTREVKDVSEESVTMSQKQLEELIDSKLETVKAENLLLKQKQTDLHKEMGLGEWNEEQIMKKRTHTSWLKLYQPTSDEEPGLIVYWKRYELIRNKLTGRIDNEIYTIKCLYPDGELKEFRITLLELAQIHNREKVEGIDIKKKKLVKIHGKVRRSAKDKEGYTRSANVVDGVEEKEGGAWVDLREVKDQVTVTIKRKNGQTYTMPDKYLNS